MTCLAVPMSSSLLLDVSLQVDPLLELLTAHEQVALYAHLKGVPRQQIGAEADSLVVSEGEGVICRYHPALLGCMGDAVRP